METNRLTLEGGLEISLVQAGPADGPPLILLHGYPMSSQLWCHCIPELARRFRVYAPDLPGHGDSAKPLDRDYDLELYLEFLRGLYQALGLGRAALAAHDLGAMAALGLAVRHPEMVSRLVIMDTAPYPDWSLVFRLMLPGLRSRLGSALLLRPRMFRLALGLLGFHRPAAFTPQAAQLFRAPWVQGPQDRRAFCRVVRVEPTQISQPAEAIRTIQAPTLILWARHDRIFPPGLARRLHRDIAGSELVILPGCGHFLPEERPGPVTEYIMNFLSQP